MPSAAICINVGWSITTASVFILKEMAKAMNYLTEHGLLAENKKLYPEQKKAKAEMMELLTIKHNTTRILGLTEDEKQREQRQEER